MEELVAQAEARGVSRREIAPETRVRLARDLHAGPRRQRRGGDPRAARRSSATTADRIVIANTKGFTGHPMGVGHRGRRRGQGARDRASCPPVPNFREVDPELGELNLSQGRHLPGPLRAAAGRRLRLADQHDAAALDAGAPTAAAATRRSSASTTGSPTARPGRGWLRRVSGQDEPQLEVVQHRLRVVDRGAGRRGAAEPEAAAVPLGAPERSRRRRSLRRRRPSRSLRPQAPSRSPPPPAPVGCRTPTRWRRGVLALVAEQTGYPTDLLDLDLDLEADLGIDTVKQAEVFAAIREAYGIERDDTLKLRDYPTLNHVVGFVQRARRRSRRRRQRPAPRAGPVRRRRRRAARP